MEKVNAPVAPHPVTRSEDGWYVHPRLNDFLDGREYITPAEFNQWLSDNNLQSSMTFMDLEDDSPLAQEWAASSSFAGWEPERPEGEGWFIGSIHESEDDGPVCLWLRQKGAA